ncbi:aminotransferase-like domain-containing protein [Streptococcus castoreus]|uniref:aminotransferase-like domain-containing protein n=1 Tax=Streptococcus castoreus TaxID=254786 RepID=UPI00048803C1|nr:PLP-dependent aminotransferase family protein [Streptococcus castoreus]
MTSKYQMIIADLDKAIQQQEFKKGDKLPSIRQLSQSYQCSKDTVQRALLELKYRHLIYAVPKSGYYVLGKVIQEDFSHDLSLEDYNNLAYEDFRLCLNEALVARDSYLFHYYHQTEGLEDLRNALLPYLASNSIYSNKSQLLITSGTQQALYILSQMTFPTTGQKILIETPTYHRMEELVKKLGLAYQTIEREFEGLNLVELETIFQTGDIKFFYTISRFSNPLGLSYSPKEKEAIVQLAKQYRIYILEDDYLGDFVNSKEPPLHYYDTNDRVIYLKSFSMSVFPALRIGTLVLPTALKTHFLAQKSMIDLDTNLLMQKALALYLENGMFQKNLKHIKHFLKQRKEDLRDFLNQEFPQLDYRLSPNNIIINCTQATLSLPQHFLKKENYLLKTTKASYLNITINQETKANLLQLLKK